MDSQKRIVYFDVEVSTDASAIRDIGALDDAGRAFHANAPRAFAEFIQDADILCGHGILDFDLVHLGKLAGITPAKSILDTLLLEGLFFPKRETLKLGKDEKLTESERNDPLLDARKAQKVLAACRDAYADLPKVLQNILCGLLSERAGFSGFFKLVEPREQADAARCAADIARAFEGFVCAHADLASLAANDAVELAYALMVLFSDNPDLRAGMQSREESAQRREEADSADFPADGPAHAPDVGDDKNGSRISPWVMQNFPRIARVQEALCLTPCAQGCGYCTRRLDVLAGLRTIFEYDSFRTYEGEPLQERACRAAMAGKSLLAIFPTGGGKSLTFQLPALLAYRATGALTVVISPLQSLMVDQVRGLREKGIAEAVVINGQIDPLERMTAFECVEQGLAGILYIAPEQLRSKSVQRALFKRHIVRFVIDEAHCLSAWGHDFRVDYFFIAEFIRAYEKQKNNGCRVAVSCFTATAKSKVVQDILDYFKTTLDIDLERFETSAERRNLRYSVLEVDDDQSKYRRLRELLDQRRGPAIVYVSTVGRSNEIAQRLCVDGFEARAYNGRLDAAVKSDNQEAFISGRCDIMVATNAFGMGVDKSDVQLVVHYDIASSLENYVQEAGRAARDEHLTAECVILFCEEDLNGIFQIIQSGHLTLREIKDVWKAVKVRSKGRTVFTCSALELARAAGWNDEKIQDEGKFEVKIKTAIAALERAGYIKREMNSPRIYANGLAFENFTEAKKRIEASPAFGSDEERRNAERICRSLMSAHRTYKARSEEAESRVDHLADRLGLTRETVGTLVIGLREIGLLTDDMDMTALLEGGRDPKTVKRRCTDKIALERFLLETIASSKDTRFNLKELNTAAKKQGLRSDVKDITAILDFWRCVEKIGAIRKQGGGLEIKLEKALDKLRGHLEVKTNAASALLDALYAKTPDETDDKNRAVVRFSAVGLCGDLGKSSDLFAPGGPQAAVSAEDVMLLLRYFAAMNLLTIDGGFLVVYQAMTIRKCVTNAQIQYKKEDYEQFDTHYHQRIEQVHVIGRYANLLLKDYDTALAYVRDYFRMDYQKFIGRYFSQQERGRLDETLTVGKYDALFGDLSEEQLAVINDKSQAIAVAAGPGSGKTRVLVRKLASLLLREQTRREELLMLTFSRAAATEFRERLSELAGRAAAGVDIKTFHSYSFDILGLVGSLEESEDVVCNALEAIRSKRVDESILTKTVLVLDEAQDMSAKEFALVEAIREANPDMRIIAVGDDDQNIFAFRDSDSRYFRQFANRSETSRHLLSANYRSAASIVAWSDAFVRTIEGRLKSTPARAVRTEPGRIRFTRHASDNLVVPVALELIGDLKRRREKGGESAEQTSAVLTYSNEDALKVYTILTEAGVQARLISDMSGISAGNLVEMRAVMRWLRGGGERNTASRRQWETVRAKFDAVYAASRLYPSCTALLERFENLQDWSGETFYISDLEMFLRESDVFDALRPDCGGVIVSTMHKAKGREFDDVRVLIDRRFLSSLKHRDAKERNESRRVLYVAMTRAKHALSVHCCGEFFEDADLAALERRTDEVEHPLQEKICLNFGYQDVNLGRYTVWNKRRLIRLQSGMPLVIGEGVFYAGPNAGLFPAVWLSKKGREILDGYRAKGYRLASAEVAAVVAWKGKEMTEEVAVVLPGVTLAKARVG